MHRSTGTHTGQLREWHRADESLPNAILGGHFAPLRQFPEGNLRAPRPSHLDSPWTMVLVLKQPWQQSPPTFPRFRNLPPELRQQIWQMAVCPLNNNWIRLFEACFETPSEGGAYVLDADFCHAQSSSGYRQRRQDRHRAISAVSLVCHEAKWVVDTMFVQLCTTGPEPGQIPKPEGRSKLLLVCPDHDRWTVNLHHPDPDPTAQDSVMPFERWITCSWDLGRVDKRFFNHSKRRLLNSMRHVTLEADYLMGDTPHDMSVFLGSLTKLSRITIQSMSMCASTRCFWKHSVSIKAPENIDATDGLLKYVKQHHDLSHTPPESIPSEEPRDVKGHFLTAFSGQEKYLVG